MTEKRRYTHLCPVCGGTFTLTRTPAYVVRTGVRVCCSKQSCLAATTAAHNAAVADWHRTNPTP